MTRESNNKKGIPVLLFLAGRLFLTITIFGQTSHEVTVSNFTFSPDQLTVSTGDTVIWNNTSGSHNVNGTKTTYPSNPESFGNSVGSGWTYLYVFNNPGTYDYRCDPHFSMGMTGKIIVEPLATGYNFNVPEAIDENNVLIYPNPARDYVTIDLPQGGEKFKSIRILDLVGKELLSFNDPAGSSYQKFDVSRFNPGLYLMQVDINNKTSIFKFVVR